ncbi:MAG: hypothetical protein ABI791_12060 [Acidobacteriota bacterium]
MFKRYFIGCLFFALMFMCAGSAAAQFGNDPFHQRDEERRQEEIKIKAMLAKQQAEHDKKEHAELLKNGEEALKISTQLEKSFEINPSLTPDDKKKLESLEKLVTKIRNELGGDDDEQDNDVAKKNASLLDGFRYLQTTTAQLLDELKKTTRFSISAAAIQTSNTLIRLTRFLRLRK